MRAPRSDAARNRERIMAAAAAAFTHNGDAATLRGIAKDAGVGVGTLFRHFATRDELVAATYEHELDRLCAAAVTLAEQRPGIDALRTWMLEFIDYMATKAGMAEALRTAIAGGLNTRLRTLERLNDSVTLLLRAGGEQAEVRADILAADVLASLGGISLMAGKHHQREQAARMIALLLDGVRSDTDSTTERSTA